MCRTLSRNAHLLPAFGQAFGMRLLTYFFQSGFINLWGRFGRTRRVGSLGQRFRFLVLNLLNFGRQLGGLGVHLCECGFFGGQFMRRLLFPFFQVEWRKTRGRGAGPGLFDEIDASPRRADQFQRLPDTRGGVA